MRKKQENSLYYSESGFLLFPEYTNKLFKKHLFLKGSNSFEGIYNLVNLHRLFQHFQSCEKRLYEASESKTNNESLYRECQISKLCILVWGSVAKFDRTLKEAPRKIKAKFFESMKPEDRTYEKFYTHFYVESDFKPDLLNSPESIDECNKYKVSIFVVIKSKNGINHSNQDSFHWREELLNILFPTSSSDVYPMRNLKPAMKYHILKFFSSDVDDRTWDISLLEKFFDFENNDELKSKDKLTRPEVLRTFFKAGDLIGCVPSVREIPFFIEDGSIKKDLLLRFFYEKDITMQRNNVDSIPSVYEIARYFNLKRIGSEFIHTTVIINIIRKLNKCETFVFLKGWVNSFNEHTTLLAELLQNLEVNYKLFLLEKIYDNANSEDFKDGDEYRRFVICYFFQNEHLNSLSTQNKCLLLYRCYSIKCTFDSDKNNEIEDDRKRYFIELLKLFFPKAQLRDMEESERDELKLYVVDYISSHITNAWDYFGSIIEYLFNEENLKDKDLKTKMKLLSTYPSDQRFSFITKQLFTKEQLKDITDCQKVVLLRKL